MSWDRFSENGKNVSWKQYLMTVTYSNKINYFLCKNMIHFCYENIHIPMSQVALTLPSSIQTIISARAHTHICSLCVCVLLAFLQSSNVLVSLILFNA